MRKIDQYLSTIDTIYPDGYERESYFRDSGEMLSPRPLTRKHSGFLLSRLYSLWWVWSTKRASRVSLRELPDSILDDIGASYEDAVREVRKSRFLMIDKGF